MVRGFDSFREQFRGYEDCYTIIGGTACDILMSEVGLDLRKKKADGTHVNERDLKKHKNDVFRLFPLAEPSARIALSPVVEEDVRQFVQAMGDETVDLERLGLEGAALEEILHTLKRIFRM